MRVRAIVAVAPDMAIGKDGALPWHYPEDLKHFKAVTLGHAVVMGRRTFESIGQPLPGRLNIVLSGRNFDHEAVTVIHDGSELDRVIERLDPGQDLYVLGGSHTYRSLADRVEEWVITRVPDKVEDADTFLDESLLDGFSLSRSTPLGDRLEVQYWTRD